MKLALYRRVSSKRQVTEGESLQGQLLKSQAWCKNNNHEIVKDYVDKGFSGFKGNRPAYNELMEDITDPYCEFDGVLTYALSRVSRNLLTLLITIDKLKKYDMKIFSVLEALPEDQSSCNLMIALQGAVAQNQSENNSLFVKDRLSETAEQGYFTGGREPFGYRAVTVNEVNGKKKRRKLAIDVDEAETIKMIFSLAHSGIEGKAFGLKAIANYLNSKGIKHRFSLWSISSLSLILHNTTYHGEMIFRKNVKLSKSHPQIIVPVPAIISKNLYEEVQKGLVDRSLENRAVKGARSPSLLTGILKCYKCGSNMIINTGKGGRYHYYKCSRRVKCDINCCDSPIIPKDKLEQEVLATIKREILTKTKINFICNLVKNKIKELSKETENARLVKEHKLANTTSGINSLYHQISQNKLKLDTSLNDYLEGLKSEQESLIKELECLKARTKLGLWKFGDNKKNQFIETVIEAFTGDNMVSTKAYLLAIVDKIVVSPEKAELEGANLKLLYAVSETKIGTSNEVPTFVSMWR